MLAFQPAHQLHGNKLAGTGLVQQLQQLFDCRVQQRLMTVVFRQALQQQGAGLAEIDLVDGAMYGAAHEILDPCVIGQVQEATHDLQQMTSDAVSIAWRIQPLRQQI